ncbi:SMC5-SMC6 complex localization factor protein 2 isoform X2 [Narcine bancroftii]|uniref:SMC5-SMC6 complex localization factor protein 2 isoform X2 n=1 Tax=Narcine bancroftii TaxID=1343680 RepID=UPI0038320ED6
MKKRKPLVPGKGQVITNFFAPDPGTGKDRLILGSPRKDSTDETSVLQNTQLFQKHVNKTPSFKSKRSVNLPSPRRSPVLDAFMKGVSKSEKRGNMGGVVKCQVTQHPGSPRVVVQRLFSPSSPYPSEGAIIQNQGENVKQSSNTEKASVRQNSLRSKCNPNHYRKKALLCPLPNLSSPPKSLDILKYSDDTNSSGHVPWYLPPRLSPRNRQKQHRLFNDDFQNSLQAYKKARELKKTKLQKGKHSYSSPDSFSDASMDQSILTQSFSLPSTSLTESRSISTQDSVLKLVAKMLPSGTLKMCKKEAAQRHHSFPPCSERKHSSALKTRFPAGLPISYSKEKRKRNSIDEDVQRKKQVSQKLGASFHKKRCESRITDKYSSGVTENICNGVLKDHNNGVLENEDTVLEADEFPEDGCLPLDSLNEKLSGHIPPNSCTRLPTEEKVKTALDSAISSKENRSGFLGRHSLVPLDSKRIQRLESNSFALLPLNEDARTSLPSQEKRQFEKKSTLQLTDAKDPEKKPRPNYLDSDDEDSCNLDSDDEEDENLMALDDLLTLQSKPITATPEKCAVSFQSSTPITPVASMSFKNSRQTNYSNSFERLLKEKQQSERLGETLKDKKNVQDGVVDNSCLTDEDDEHSMDEGMDQIEEEHRAFILKFSVKSDGIPDLHPGEKIFNVLEAGKHFNQHNLKMTQSELTAQNFVEKILLGSGTSQKIFLFTNGIVSQAYYMSPCPQAVYKFLFKMMTIHSDYIVSVHIFKALWDIWTNAANRIVKGGTNGFKVWTPSVKDIVSVFLNLGAQFGTLFPLKHLQPDFSETDILSELQNDKENDPKDNVPTSQGVSIFSTLPEFGIKNVVKFLLLCTSICPEAYSDKELVLLISLLVRIGLEQELQLTPLKDLQCLLKNLLNNIRHWSSKMFELCKIISDLSKHHHNLVYLVQLLPDFCTRGRQLRRHLSLVIISKLLDKEHMYVPKDPDLKISNLCRYLYMMKPSSLLKSIEEENKSRQEEEQQFTSLTELDQQAYYLCYNLLVLANEVIHVENVPPSQRGHLKQLCAEIEKYIKCSIREDHKLLYRSKVKDLEARTHAKWQELLQRSRPVQGKLHDYWEPSREDLNHPSQSCPLDEGTEHYTVQELAGDEEDLDLALVQQI